MELISGYRIPYDPFPNLEKLEFDRENALNELWANLYHQGDVDTASYASVPKLVELNELSLVSAIEVARQSEHNPKIPEHLKVSYFQSLETALKSTPETQEQFQGFYIIHASLNGQLELAKALSLLSVEEILAEYE